MKVYLINEMEREFKDKYDGKEIVIPPGYKAKIPDYVAYHFIGDPRIEDEEEKIAEQKRIAFRYGAIKPEEREAKIPKLRIEPAEEEVKVVKAEKTEITKVATDDEFPELKEVECPVEGCDYKGTPKGLEVHTRLKHKE